MFHAMARSNDFSTVYHITNEFVRSRKPVNGSVRDVNIRIIRRCGTRL